MNLELAGRTALVVGASRGIGLAIAKTLHAEGCNVALVARDAAAIKDAADSLGNNTSAHAADVQDPHIAKRVVAEAMNAWGHLDIAICNVGSGASVPPGQESPEEWRRVFDVNFTSAINVIEAARPGMRAANHGSIVCISSIVGLAALGAPITYSAAKSALNAAVRGLARPLAAEGIRINAVAPGNILTAGGTWDRKLAENPEAVRRMLTAEVAQGRLGTPEEIADVVAFLASPRASFVTGAIYVADGGQLRA